MSPTDLHMRTSGTDRDMNQKLAGSPKSGSRHACCPQTCTSSTHNYSRPVSQEGVRQLEVHMHEKRSQTRLCACKVASTIGWEPVSWVELSPCSVGARAAQFNGQASLRARQKKKKILRCCRGPQ
eukprot:1136791-Pelagomonas_calceolata.AAC.13